MQSAIAQSNSGAIDADEAEDVLRLSRKAACSYNEELLENIILRYGSLDDEAGYPVEYYFANQKLVEISKGVDAARKDNRISEKRGFFLSPRQPIPFCGMDQQTEEGSISTLWRNGLYLFIMGLCPILISAWRLRRICRSG